MMQSPQQLYCTLQAVGREGTTKFSFSNQSQLLSTQRHSHTFRCESQPHCKLKSNWMWKLITQSRKSLQRYGKWNDSEKKFDFIMQHLSHYSGYPTSLSFLRDSYSWKGISAKMKSLWTTTSQNASAAMQICRHYETTANNEAKKAKQELHILLISH